MGPGIHLRVRAGPLLKPPDVSGRQGLRLPFTPEAAKPDLVLSDVNRHDILWSCTAGCAAVSPSDPPSIARDDVETNSLYEHVLVFSYYVRNWTVTKEVLIGDHAGRQALVDGASVHKELRYQLVEGIRSDVCRGCAQFAKTDDKIEILPAKT